MGSFYLQGPCQATLGMLPCCSFQLLKRPDLPSLGEFITKTFLVQKGRVFDQGVSVSQGGVRTWGHNQRNCSLKRKHGAGCLYPAGNSSVSAYLCQGPGRDTEDSPWPAAHGSGPKSHHCAFKSTDPLILNINPTIQGLWGAHARPGLVRRREHRLTLRKLPGHSVSPLSTSAPFLTPLHWVGPLAHLLFLSQTQLPLNRS